jgi:4-hydroxy-tetrahydrodipicolinate synthase
MSEPIGGFWVAMATPLTEAGAVDHAAMVRHTKRLFSEGCDGVVLFGTTGEGTSFSANERLAATEALVRAGIAPERIGLGAGFPATTDSIALIRQARSLGLVHALLLPPYFYRDVSPGGIEDAFAAILDGVGDDKLRATLYHIPQVSGVGVPPDVVARLRARYGRVLAGVKDSSADFAQFRAFRAAAPDVAVTIGNEVDIGRALAEGGTGTICGMGNLVPRLVRAMFAGDRAVPAMREAISLITAGPFLPGLKAALAALTGEAGWARVRPPLRPSDMTRGAEVAAALLRLQSGSAG